MARIRTIKPEFFTDEKVGSVSRDARLLFVGAWVFADDYGTLDRSAKQLKAQIFPYDDLDCDPLVDELLHVGLLAEYEVDCKTYLIIPGFSTHQRVDKPSNPRRPLPDDSQSSLGTLGEPSQSPRSGREGKGREGKGKERNARERDDDARPDANLQAEADRPPGLNPAVWDRWCDYRVKIRKPLKPVSMPAAQRELAAFGSDQAAVVEQSIAQGWQGLFELKRPAGVNGSRACIPQRKIKTADELEAEALARAAN